MKHLKFLSFIAMINLLSCSNENSTHKILSLIPGVYVRTFAGEFSTGHDTLFISQPDSKNNYYTVRHNSSYQKIREKQVRPLEYKSENWTALFNEKDNVLVEQKKGKVISFLPEENSLLLGNSKFHKIK
jgi:hypothetical protein